MKTVCAYIRVSTDSQEEYSPDAQIRLLKEYAASHDMTIIDIYQDLGISGRNADKRPQFQDMIAMAKSKGASLRCNTSMEVLSFCPESGRIHRIQIAVKKESCGCSICIRTAARWRDR